MSPVGAAEVCYADFAYARPSPASIKAGGYRGVIRYLSPDPEKNLTLPEYEGYKSVGLDTLLVYESTGTDSLQGAPAGARDVASAESQAVSLGYPTDPAHPLFYANDFGPTPAQLPTIEQYYAAIAEGRRTHLWGPYGAETLLYAIRALPISPLAWWQTEAWSGTSVAPFANLYQRVTPSLSIPGLARGQWDEDVLLVPFSSTPIPTLPPPTVYPEDDMVKTPVSVLIENGEGWVPSPVPVANVFACPIYTENPEVIDEFAPVPTWTGKATQVGPHSPNGALTFAGPNGTFGLEIWSSTPTA